MTGSLTLDIFLLVKALIRQRCYIDKYPSIGTHMSIFNSADGMMGIYINNLILVNFFVNDKRGITMNRNQSQNDFLLKNQETEIEYVSDDSVFTVSDKLIDKNRAAYETLAKQQS